MRKRQRKGFTLIELMIAIAIVGVLAAMATVRYDAYIERVRVTRAILDIKVIATEIDGRLSDDDPPPPSLASLGLQRNDPWGFPYRYTPLRDGRRKKINIGKARKDRFLVPLNDDYDLYSVGKNGLSTGPIGTPRSRDDVIRANNGSFIGLADRY